MLVSVLTDNKRVFTCECKWTVLVSVFAESKTVFTWECHCWIFHLQKVKEFLHGCVNAGVYIFTDSKKVCTVARPRVAEDSGEASGRKDQLGNMTFLFISWLCRNPLL